ncbi:hypothetical protein WJX73_000390 [Symbiochloris irregularis]|uniref:Coatomer subunit beta' n=1 Tax=Symbiochloris irregularis TaxID=706552 RepID=A0AAW1PFP8_9CHLO
MPLRLDIKRRFLQRSDRVKGVDLHPTEPWLLTNLYNGHVYLWNINDQSLVKSFEVTELPVRAAKFIARKQWVVCGADDMFIRVYNYNTMDKVKHFEGHTDYIRSLAVHPSLPYLLSSSDDMLIKLWDWDKGWTCTQVFEGHSHYVMQVTFNPKDSNTFASASLDRTVKVWSIGQPTPNFTLEGHEKGVNTVDYFTGGDRPYLISGADDHLAKVWDYQTKACVQTLEGHAHNVSSACFHPELPIIVTGSEDGTVRLWHSTTYRLENTLNYGLERLWAVGYCRGSNSLALGFDEGSCIIKVGREEPVASMDGSGKIIWARHNEIQTVNVKSLGADQEADGERLPLAVKDLGSCDLYPQSLQHNPNGRFVTVCGDGEYIIYTALAWRNKSFGTALEFVWGEDSSVFAIRESSSVVKVFKNFKETATLRVAFGAEGLHGGALLAVRSNDFICFYDWATTKVVRRIDVPVREVMWAESGELVTIISDASFYVLRFDRSAVDAFAATGEDLPEDGIEEAFELLNEVSETVRTGLWVGDCFVYNNSAWRLNYCVGGEVTTMFHLDRPMFLLGYLASQSRVYLIDKEFGVVSYTLLLALIEYKTLVMRGDMEAAEELLPSIPKDQMNSVARFLEARGLVEQALELATEADYRFELAVHLGKLDTALAIAETADSEAKWRQLGELALANGQLTVARNCLSKAKDLSGMLLLHTATGSSAGMQSLVGEASDQGKHNVEFLAAFLLGQLSHCVDLLISCGRIPEAAFFARTYVPSRISEVVHLWRADLAKINPRAAESLADPAQYANLFPNLDLAVQAEKLQAQKRAKPIPASAFPQHEGSSMVDVIQQMGALGLDGEDMHTDEFGASGRSADANGDHASQSYGTPVDDAPIQEEDFLTGSPQQQHMAAHPSGQQAHHTGSNPAPPLATFAPPTAPAPVDPFASVAPLAAPAAAAPAVAAADEDAELDDDEWGVGDEGDEDVGDLEEFDDDDLNVDDEV